ncbi:MAG: hypothetical protein JNM17_30765 [Archangium sp.]|nr:hypothetical protein [Archangium sp.]
MTAIPRNAAYAKAMELGREKLAASKAHAAEVTRAKQAVSELKPQVESAEAKVAGLKAQLEKAPAHQRPALVKKLKDAEGALRTVKDKVFEADVKVRHLETSNMRFQSEAFAAQRDANLMAKELGSSVLPFPLVDGFESMGQLATMDPKRYAEVIGGEPLASSLKKGGGEMVSAVKNAATAGNGAQVLADKLKNASPALQKQILEGAHAELGVIASRATWDRAALRSYADAVSAADPTLRPVLIKELAKRIKVSPSELYEAGRSGNGGKPGFTTELRRAIKDGKGIELVAPLMTELKALGKTDEAKALAGNVAKAIGDIRADFKKKRDVVVDTQADLTRLVYGFKDTMTPQQLDKAIATFTDRHTSEFDALDDAANASLALVRQLETLPDDPALVEAKNDLKGDLPKILETRAGQKEIKAQLKQQVLGNPNWLEKLGSWAGDSKTLLGAKGEVAGIVTKAAASLALSGGALQKLDMGKFLVANRALLDLDMRGAATLSAAMKKFDPTNAASHLAFDDALKSVSPKNAKALKGLGVVLSLPGTIAGWKDLGDKALHEQMQTVVGTGAFAASTTEYLIEAFTKADSLKGLGKGAAIAGKVLGAAGALLEGFGAVKSFADGNIGDGVAGSMSAVGGLLMLGGPAGVAAGAALTLGSFVVKKVWGSDPAAEAEAADEADAKAFLTAGGLPPNVAEAFSDVVQTDRRNIGTFLNQVAAKIGVPTPELMKHLAKFSTDDLESLVDKVKDLKADDDWKYDESPRMVQGTAPSFFSTLQWMYAKGMVPEK